MDGGVRRKMEMAERVLAFLRAHPFSDPSEQAIVARLEERHRRAEALALQQRSSSAPGRRTDAETSCAAT